MIRILVAFFTINVAFGSTQDTGQDERRERFVSILKRERSHPEAREAAAAFLIADPADAVALAEDLGRSPAWSQRRAALTLLGRLGPEAVFTSGYGKLQLHEDPVWAVRATFFEVLAGVNADDVDGALEAAMRDPVWRIRRAALAVIAASSSRPGPVLLEALARSLDDEDQEVARTAITVLGKWAPLTSSLASRLAEAAFRDATLPLGAARGAAVALADSLRSRSWPGLDENIEVTARMKPFAIALGILAAKSSPRRLADGTTFLANLRHRTAIGGELESRIRQGLVNDPGLGALVLAAAVDEAGRELCKVALNSKSPDWGRPALRTAFLDDLISDYDPTTTALEEIAFLPPPGIHLLLERFILANSAASAGPGLDHVDRLRAMAYRIRLGLNPPIADDLLEAVLADGPVNVAREAALRVWEGTNDRHRGMVITSLPQWKERSRAWRQVYAELLSVMARTSNSVARPLFSSALEEDHRRRERLSAIEGLVALGGASTVKQLRRRLASETDVDVRKRLESSLVRLGEPAAIDALLSRLGRESPSNSRRSAEDLAGLRFVDTPRAYELVRRRLDETRYDERTLPLLVESALRLGGKPAAVDTLRRILASLATNRDSQITGRTLEHLMDRLDAVELIGSALDLVAANTVSAMDDLLDGVVEIVVRHDLGAEFSSRFLRLWEDAPAGAGGFERRQGLLAPLVRCGGAAGRALVVRFVDRQMERLARGASSANDHALIAELLSTGLGALLRWGERDGIEAVAERLFDVEDRFITRLTVVKEESPSQRFFEDHEELDEIFISAFEESPSRSLVEDVFRGIRVERAQAGKSIFLSRGLVVTWLRVLALSPRGRHPRVLLADRVLELPPARSPPTSLLVVLAHRLLLGDDDGAARRSAALLRRWHQRAAVEAGVVRLPVFGFDAAALFSSGGESRRAAVNWTARLAAVRLGRTLPTGVEVAEDDRFLPGILSCVGALHARGRLESAWALWRAGREWGGRGSPPQIVRCRMLLDERRFDEAALVAGRLAKGLGRLGRTLVFGESEPFIILEAAALWGLDRRREARARLDEVSRHGKLGRWPEYEADDFPGMKPLR